MRDLRSDLVLHRNGALSALAAGLLYLMAHFLFPFVVQTKALLFDLMFEVAMVSIIAFLGVGLVFRRSFRPVTQGVWLALTLATGMLYAVLVPTVLDRSLSIYILSKIDPDRGTSISRLSEEVQADYFKDYDVIAVRLNEQSLSGNLAIAGDRVMVTPRGRRVAALTAWYRSRIETKYRD